MDIGHFYSPPTELHRTQSRPKANAKSSANPSAKLNTKPSATMENKGWRKKIAGKSKDLPHIKTGDETTASPLTEDSTDRRRHHGWRKTIAVSRSTTPTTQTPTTPVPEDVDDTRSERSEASTPRRDSKPKPVRYTSLFAAQKDEPAGPNFAEPWSAQYPPPYEPQVNPVVAMASIHSHMCKNHTTPVPLEYNSGLFRIFDDYRKLREHKDYLDVLEQETRKNFSSAKARWLESERHYEAEIRRLEMLIARGATGMTGLIQARQGTVLDRKRRHRKTISTDRLLPRYERMSLTEIDEEIKTKIQQVLLHRPTSPSGKMTALSQQLAHTGVLELPIGTPPLPGRDLTLSRKVKSEHDLVGRGRSDSSQYSPDVTPTYLPPTAKPLSQREPVEVALAVGDTIECDAFVALKELGALVARRKGLDVGTFLNGLMALFDSGYKVETDTEQSVHEDVSRSSAAGQEEKALADDMTPRPPLQKPRLELHHKADPKRRRHFSFEPGDDQMQELEVSLRPYDSLSQTDSTESDSTSSAVFRTFAERTNDDDLNPLLASFGTDILKPSMIPSPVQTMGRVRRENSMSSLQSVFVKNFQDDRHNSRTSIQTVLRKTSSNNASAASKSRSSSNHNLRTAESPLASKERLDSLTDQHNTAALAAARAAEARSGSLSRSNTRLSTAMSSSRKIRTTGKQKLENNDPETRDNASKGNVE